MRRIGTFPRVKDSAINSPGDNSGAASQEPAHEQFSYLVTDIFMNKNDFMPVSMVFYYSRYYVLFLKTIYLNLEGSY